MHASAYRLANAITEFTTAHQQDPAHKDLLAALGALNPQLAALNKNAAPDSPGRQAAREATLSADMDSAAAKLAARMKPTEPKLADDQPKTFQDASQAAEKHLSSMRGEPAA